jgi:hypothetical protein
MTFDASLNNVRNHRGQDVFVEFGWDACMRFMQEVSGSELLFLLLLQDSPTNNFSGLSSNEWNFTTLV